MGNFVCESIVLEERSAERLVYILKDNQFYYPTAYKILKNHENNNFLDCYQSFLNGKVKFSYAIQGYNTLRNYENNLPLNQYLMIIIRLLGALEEFRSNGFIQMETIDLSYDKIFLDAQMNIHLVSVPVAIQSTTETQMSFEQAVKALIFEIVERSGYQQCPDVALICQDCKDNRVTVNDMLLNFKMKRYSTEVDVNQEESKQFLSQIILDGINSDNQIRMEAQNAVLGKSVEYADKVVTGSTSVSRKHCKISYVRGSFFVEDLGSLNHTYVNGKMIAQGEISPLNVGDTLKLADLEFMVK